MSDRKLCSAFAQLVLAGTSAWGLRNLPPETWGFGTLVLHFVHGVTGVLRFVAPSDNTEKLFDDVSYLSVSLAVPCLATHMYLAGGYRQEIAYAHIGVALLPVVAKCLDKREESLERTVLAVNTISLAYVAYIKQGFSLVSAAALFGLNFFVLTPDGDDVFGVPGIDVFAYGLAAFNGLVLKGFDALKF